MEWEEERKKKKIKINGWASAKIEKCFAATVQTITLEFYATARSTIRERDRESEREIEENLEKKNAIESEKKCIFIVYMYAKIYLLSIFCLSFAFHFCCCWSSLSFIKSCSQHGSEMNRRWKCIGGGFCMVFCFRCICWCCCSCTCACDKTIRDGCKRASVINVLRMVCRQASIESTGYRVLCCSKHCAFPIQRRYHAAVYETLLHGWKCLYAKNERDCRFVHGSEWGNIVSQKHINRRIQYCHPFHIVCSCEQYERRAAHISQHSYSSHSQWIQCRVRIVLCHWFRSFRVLCDLQNLRPLFCPIHNT